MRERCWRDEHERGLLASCKEAVSERLKSWEIERSKNYNTLKFFMEREQNKKRNNAINIFVHSQFLICI